MRVYKSKTLDDEGTKILLDVIERPLIPFRGKNKLLNIVVKYKLENKKWYRYSKNRKVWRRVSVKTEEKLNHLLKPIEEI